jgi:hypothetical protein
MTIAVCYVSPEGLVLGADSTSSAVVAPGGFHYFNYNQKLFELGQENTIGVLTWGLGGLGVESHRKLLAIMADDLKQTPATNVREVADRWATMFWDTYTTCPATAPAIQICKALGSKPPFSQETSSPQARTQNEEELFKQLKRGLVTGFCVAGYVLPSRTPEAFEIIFDPLSPVAPTPTPISVGSPRFWGAPNIILRLIRGADPDLRANILASGKWTGTSGDLDSLLNNQILAHPILPIRDAIDFVHGCIYAIIKALKFSHLSQICGGPIEIAVITADRSFRWVRHKELDAAITDGGNV